MSRRTISCAHCRSLNFSFNVSVIISVSQKDRLAGRPTRRGWSVGGSGRCRGNGCSYRRAAQKPVILSGHPPGAHPTARAFVAGAYPPAVSRQTSNGRPKALVQQNLRWLASPRVQGWPCCTVWLRSTPGRPGRASARLCRKAGETAGVLASSRLSPLPGAKPERQCLRCCNDRTRATDCTRHQFES